MKVVSRRARDNAEMGLKFENAFEVQDTALVFRKCTSPLVDPCGVFRPREALISKLYRPTATIEHLVARTFHGRTL